MIDKICEICGAAFRVRNYRANTARFCSGSCRASWVGSLPHNRRPKPYMIGNKLRQGLRPANAFPLGPRGPQVERVSFTCEQCAKVVDLVPWEVKGRGGNPRFCSRKCFTKSGCFVAEKSVAYLGGPIQPRGADWRAIRAVVVAEQEGNCKDCGVHVGASLPVHHIEPYRNFTSDDEAHARSNLVGLCSRCHAKADREVERLKRSQASAS